MNLIDQMAHGDPLKYDDVFLLPNSIVFVKRMMMAQSRKYQIEYKKVLREKKNDS